MLHSILGVFALIGFTAAECSRQVLQEQADKYVQSVTAGKLDVAANVEYSENFKSVSIGSGLLSKPVKISLKRHLIDTTACATFTEIVAHENAPPLVIGTQIRYTQDGKANKIEALVTSKENGFRFGATETYTWAAKENRPIIPEGKRDSRATIQAVADAYLDKFSNGSVQIPIAQPCERLEGNMHLAPNCIIGIPDTTKPKKNNMIDRRYVIDETVGTVDVFLKFGGTMPDSHEFRVEAGKLKIVHTITVGTREDMAKGKEGFDGGPVSAARI
jgi:hypothetical protein